MSALTNLWVLISGYYMMSFHQVTYIDNIIITSYIMLSLWLMYIIHHIMLSRKRVIWTVSSAIQFIFPTAFTIFWFISGQNVQWFTSNIKIFW